MVTAIAGLETGAITTKERINDTGIYKKYGIEMKCWYYTSYRRGHGYLNVTQALQHSCNYFFYETGDRMGISTLAKYALHFGLGKKTGIELPSEKAGTVASKNINGLGDTLNAAIGQGNNSFTPIQIAKYISSIANGGTIVQPSIVKTIMNSDGTEVSPEEIRKYVNTKLGITDEDDGIQISPESIQVAKEGMRMAQLSWYRASSARIVWRLGSFMSMPSARVGSKTLWRVCEKPQETFFFPATRMISGTRRSLQK